MGAWFLKKAGFYESKTSFLLVGNFYIEFFRNFIIRKGGNKHFLKIGKNFH